MSGQAKIIALRCTSCGGSLEISDDIEQFACGYCGIQQIVERREGTVAIKPVTDAIRRVQVGTDRTAAELAIRRLKEEITEIEKRQSACAIEGDLNLKKIADRYIWYYSFAIVICLFSVSKLSGWVALFLLVASCVVISRMKAQERKPIIESAQAKIRELQSQIEEKQARIESHKALLDE